VTEEQIEEFNLPPMPKSKETIDKVNHDTRKEGFIKKYGKLYVVELDALLAIRPDEFKRIVQESVDQFFDQGIYQAVLSDHQPELVDRLVQERHLSSSLGRKIDTFAHYDGRPPPNGNACTCWFATN
jgi:hypothetical protein